MNKPLLEVKDLKTYFYLTSGIVKAVDGVSFSIDAGRTLGIVGESGSGKSVTASSIIRLMTKTSRIVGGEVWFDGRLVNDLNTNELLSLRGREISTIFQDPMTSLDPVFTVKQQMIEMLLEHFDMTRQQALETSIEALRTVSIPEPEIRINAYPYQLSGGMCQRVIIAMALCANSKMIIADEPTTALDVTVQAQVLRLLKDVQRKNNVSILLITHNLGVVWEMCHDVLVMYAGKAVEYAPVGEIYSNPLHPYTWGLMESMPHLDMDKNNRLATIEGAPPDLRLTGQACNFANRCPYALQVCHEKVPQSLEIEPGHFVACHRQQKNNRLSKGSR